MSTIQLPMSVHQLPRETLGRVNGNHTLFQALLELVGRIEEAKHEIDCECWADDEYEYIEVTLPDGIDAELDLNVHGPHVFIRSVRNDS